VRLQFPHGILDIPVPDWQQRQTRNDVLGLALIGVAVLIMIAGPLLVILLWYTRGRDPETGLVVPDYLTEPPEPLPPALVGTLVDEKANMRDIVSTIVDLARRGYLVISEQKSTHTFHRTSKSDHDLRPFERQLLHNIFGRKKERKLSALRYKFHKKLPQLRTMLYEEMVEYGFADHSPEKIRGLYTVLSVFIFFAAVAIFIGASASLPGEISYVSFCLGFAIGITGVALAIAARAMPAKTAKGAEEATKWLAFKQYLQNIEQYEDLVDKQAIFEKYLPYVTAFGLDRTWIRKFSQVPHMPIPPWYYGTGHPVLVGGSRASGRTVTSGDSRAGSGGLEGMSDSLSGGLESISSGLTRMLNSTASTLKSTPPSSSSSSGGFSGGGSFSSSGGGSRGFG